jgi:hypothetical protein
MAGWIKSSRTIQQPWEEEMILVVRVKLVVAEKPAVGVSGVKVALFDRDDKSDDDILGTAVTDNVGKTRFVFDSEKYTDLEDQPAWRLDSLPDLFVVVYDTNDEVVLTTRAEAQENKIPDEIIVPISKELLERYHLLVE